MSIRYHKSIVFNDQGEELFVKLEKNWDGVKKLLVSNFPSREEAEKAKSFYDYRWISDGEILLILSDKILKNEQTNQLILNYKYAKIKDNQLKWFENLESKIINIHLFNNYNPIIFPIAIEKNTFEIMISTTDGKITFLNYRYYTEMGEPF